MLKAQADIRLADRFLADIFEPVFQQLQLKGRVALLKGMQIVQLYDEDSEIIVGE
ncbi:hypothetical protein D3C80_2033670 [compost metagenome]